MMRWFALWGKDRVQERECTRIAARISAKVFRAGLGPVLSFELRPLSFEPAYYPSPPKYTPTYRSTSLRRYCITQRGWGRGRMCSKKPCWSLSFLK